MAPRKPNKIGVDAEGVTVVDISTPKHPNVWTKIDAADADFIRQSSTRWYVLFDTKGAPYVVRSFQKDGRQVAEALHRVLLGLTDDKMCGDHKNHDTLDNRRENLREASCAENARNCRSEKGSSSRHLGVSWDKKSKKWHAQLVVNYVHFSLGRFDSEDAAARAYDAAAERHFGAFANLNFSRARAA